MDKTSEPSEYNGVLSKNEILEPMTKVCNKNENTPKNPLLYLFVEYAWDPRHGPCYNGHDYKRLESWLEVVEAGYFGITVSSRNAEGSLYRPPRNPSSIRSYADLLRRTQDSRDMIILDHVANKLKEMIDILNSSKGDVNYRNKKNCTVLELFLLQCRDVPADAPEDRISRILKVIKRLIEMGVPLYTTTHGPFLIAIRSKNPQILQTLISCVEDVEGSDEFGNTALHVVVDNCVDKEGNHKDGYVDLVRTLVSKGANVNARNSKGVTPVHLAAAKFQTEMLRFFADQGANFDGKTYDNETSLHVACKSTVNLKDSSKITETFDFLVAQGCDLEAANQDASTLLHFAAEFRSVEVVERLIALGLKIDARIKKTLLTPLYLAAKGDKLNNIKALVKAGADVNAEAADGSTPIFMSAMMGSHESLQFLMDHGAELHRRDSLMGFTLLHMAANGVELRPTFGAPPNTPAKYRLKKLKMLMDKGLDVNDAGIVGVTPLQLAILAPNVDAVKLLLDRGANANFRNQLAALELALLTCDTQRAYAIRIPQREPGRYLIKRQLKASIRSFHVGVYPDEVKKDDVRLSCPIMKSWSCEPRRYACEYLEISLMLVAHGADVNFQNASGETPLHAVMFYNDGALEKFLEAGAHVNVEDDEGKLLIHTVWKKHDEKLKLLLDFGADVNDDDVSKLIVSETCKSRDVVVMHAIKRKLVGLAIAKVYESLIPTPEFADFYEQCSEEAIKLKNHRDDDGFSLYEFLRMNPKFQYHFVEKISRDYKNLEQQFPLYAGLIRGACRESAVRRQLLEPARIVWAENSGVNLPEVCVENILSYLSNRYLKVMITTPKEIKIKSVPDEKVVFEYYFADANWNIFD